MSLNRERKIRKLMSKVLEPMEKGTTSIDVTTIPYAEQILYEKVGTIFKTASPDAKLGDLSEKQQQLLHTFDRRIKERILDLFHTFLEAYYYQDCDMAKTQAHLRLYWFLTELAKDSAIWKASDRIEAEHAEDTDDVDYVDEYFKTQPDTFTEASWDRLEQKLQQRWIKHLEETGQLEEIQKNFRLNEHDTGIK